MGDFLPHTPWRLPPSEIIDKPLLTAKQRVGYTSDLMSFFCSDESLAFFEWLLSATFFPNPCLQNNTTRPTLNVDWLAFFLRFLLVGSFLLYTTATLVMFV